MRLMRTSCSIWAWAALGAPSSRVPSSWPAGGAACVHPPANTPRMTAATRRSRERGVMCSPCLEVDLHIELREPGQQDRGRPLPGAEAVIERQGSVGIQRIEHIDAEGRPGPAEREQLGEPEIELVQPLAVHRARLDDVDRLVRGAARQVTSE